MKKKLLSWEASWETIVILITISVFLIIFSVQNGWGMNGVERYNTAFNSAIVLATIAAVTTICIISVVAGVGGGIAIFSVIIVAAIAIAVVVAITSAITIIIAGGSVIIETIATTAGVVAGTAVFAVGAGAVILTIIATTHKELKNSFGGNSLIIEGLVIFGTILTITFLF